MLRCCNIINFSAPSCKFSSPWLVTPVLTIILFSLQSQYYHLKFKLRFFKSFNIFNAWLRLNNPSFPIFLHLKTSQENLLSLSIYVSNFTTKLCNLFSPLSPSDICSNPLSVIFSHLIIRGRFSLQNSCLNILLPKV